MVLQSAMLKLEAWVACHVISAKKILQQNAVHSHKKLCPLSILIKMWYFAGAADEYVVLCPTIRMNAMPPNNLTASPAFTFSIF